MSFNFSASMFKRISRIVTKTAVSAAAMLAAPAAVTAAELALVRVGTTSVSTDIGFFLADKKGYFKEQGIEVSFLTFSSAAKMVAPLGIGQLDVGGGTVAVGLYNAVGRGIDVKVVADKGSIKPGYGFSALMVRKDLVDSGRYKSYKDLKGMTVAVGMAGTGTTSALNEALKKGGLKYSDVKVVDMAFPQHMFAFANKAIDASITNEPTVTRAVKENVALRVAGNDEIYPGQQTAAVLYSGEFIKNRPDIAKKFMRAYLRGVRDYNRALLDGKIAGPGADEVLAALTEYTSIKDRELYRAIVPHATNPDGRVNLASMKIDYAFFKEQGLVTSKATVEQVVDNSFVDEVVQELGPYAAAK